MSINKKYVLRLNFTNDPECNKCMLGRYTGKDLDGNSIMLCQAIGNSPKCPDEGCRKDCPLELIGSDGKR